VDWIQLVRDADKWRAFLYMVIEIRTA